MARKKNYNYFDMFISMVDYSCQASKMLHTVLNNFDKNILPEKIKEMHEIENNADYCRHDMVNQLTQEFITPIEREDIINLAQEIDDITDNIEDVLLNIYMFNITTIREDALKFVDIISNCCDALKKATEDFHNFRKSKLVKNSIIEINRLEETGDKLYTESVHRLYVNCSNPIEIISWTKILDRLEKCCDSCERVANIMEGIIMKNS